MRGCEAEPGRQLVHRKRSRFAEDGAHPEARRVGKCAVQVAEEAEIASREGVGRLDRHGGCRWYLFEA